ncbi:hypothetical protein ADL22_02085 [Streptomyces sp. NRRL F-4489]|uniref:hypothetical protein n=1 Tax=Streptomyces sp. NRRL F-4489 TaxID=1609095 RepID=UPI000748A6EF|nr:hypothetical protein [Streptomyces sp. NRRL F-4489]KUL54917.1 hypothetical protein ADL22_02085 [Streptomyces sp. NRRL F-4489]
MTIYSQHANRGKTQILATYQGPGGLRSSTVTSLSSPALAAPVVDALNRISALATVPVSVHDRRDGDVDSYPTRHLGALTERSARAELLSGAHSLWYEYACMELHQALSDLDDALAVVPEPIRIAIDAELAEEARALREELAEYREGSPESEPEKRRHWDFGQPCVLYGGGVDMLSSEVREQLDRLEEGATPEERAKGIVNLRVLVGACSRFPDMIGGLESGNLEIFAEPYEEDGYYFSVQAPEVGEGGSDSWVIEIGRWEPDDPDEDYEECGSATGGTVLRCELSGTPSAEAIAGLLDRICEEPGLLAEWAGTRVGVELAGTGLLVTEVYED